MANASKETNAQNLEVFIAKGGPGCAKTQSLILRAHQLAKAEPNSKVLVFCASPVSARSFSWRLEKEEHGDIAANIEITTPRAYALKVLSDSRARDISGRDPFMLTSTEENFLMEDLKVSGLRTKRLREMLKFFFRSLSEMANENEDWLISSEEKQIYALLKDNLAMRRALLECEVSATALRCVNKSEGVSDDFAVSHVLVDDFTSLSRASQHLVCALANTSLYVAGDEDECTQTYDSYPYAKGFIELEEAFPQAKKVALDKISRPQALLFAAERLAEMGKVQEEGEEEAANAGNGESTGAAAGTSAHEASISCQTSASSLEGIEVLSSTDPAEEMQSIVSLVAAKLEQGENARDIVIATPNATWAKNATRALTSAHIACENPFIHKRIAKGDIRAADRSINARILALLDLVADPMCATAWRSCCGFGDYLVYSSALAAIRTYCIGEDITLADALEKAQNNKDIKKAIFGEHTVGDDDVLFIYKTVKAQIEQLRNGAGAGAGADAGTGAGALEGSALLDALTHFATNGEQTTTPEEIATVCLSQECENAPDNSAAAMAKRAREAQNEPVLSDDANRAICVLPYDGIAGLSPKVLIVSGFVNGFIPSRDYFDTTVTTLDRQKIIHAQDARRVYALVSAATQSLVLSHFSKVSLEHAEMLKLKIVRIRLEDGVRTCLIAPSDFLETITS